MTKNSEIIQKENAVATYDDAMMGSWGTTNEFDSSDIIIPKIMLMQGSSQLVNDGIAKPGDYLHSVNKEILGSTKDPVTFTPVHMTKKWRVTKKDGNDYKFSHYEDVNASNIGNDKEFMIGNIPSQRQLCYNFYVLIKGWAVPFILQMKGISHGAGKQLANEMFLVNSVEKLPPAGKNFILLVEDIDFDNKKYKGYKVKTNEVNEKNYVMGTCLEWYKTITAGEVKEDTTEEFEGKKTVRNAGPPPNDAPHPADSDTIPY